jgi:hypothetical protein
MSRFEAKEGSVLIGILNQSTLIANADVMAMTLAVAEQVRMDAGPIWDRIPAAVVYYTDPSAVPDAAHLITIVDTILDQPRGLLGFHTEEQRGKLWGVVAAKPPLDNGAQVTTGNWSISSVLSHEVLEVFIDPGCNLWSADENGSAYSFEVCDPVEAPSYEIDGVAVSNFVTPAWFDPLIPSTAQFDKLGLLRAPFSILKGGYVIYTSAGKEQQRFGDEFPQWRREMKAGPSARTRRRLIQAADLAD